MLAFLTFPQEDSLVIVMILSAQAPWDVFVIAITTTDFEPIHQAAHFTASTSRKHVLLSSASLCFSN